jgi:DnaK suppressor protein
MIDHNTISELQAKLLTEKADLETQLARHGRELADGDWVAMPPEIDSSEEDMTSQSDEMEQFENDIANLSVLEARHKDVVDAIAKIDAGNYGICEESGEEIEIDRLMANPAARTNKANM